MQTDMLSRLGRSALLAAMDVRSPVVDELPADFDLERFRADFMEPECSHTHLTVLRNYSDQPSDCEEMDVQCKGCGALLELEIWHNETPAVRNLMPMHGKRALQYMTPIAKVIS